VPSVSHGLLEKASCVVGEDRKALLEQKRLLLAETPPLALNRSLYDGLGVTPGPRRRSRHCAGMLSCILLLEHRGRECE